MTELSYNIPIENTINKWLTGTQLVGKFRTYPGKLYFTNEFFNEEGYNMKLI
jgi:hypothetical protein